MAPSHQDANQLPDPALRIKIIHQLSIIKANQGETDEAFKLREQLINSPDYHLLPPFNQANLLHHIGVWHLREGRYDAAKTALTRCLTISSEHNLWEMKAYALNQLGNFALFVQGDFKKGTS